MYFFIIEILKYFNSFDFITPEKNFTYVDSYFDSLRLSVAIRDPEMLCPTEIHIEISLRSEVSNPNRYNILHSLQLASAINNLYPELPLLPYNCRRPRMKSLLANRIFHLGNLHGM